MIHLVDLGQYGRFFECLYRDLIIFEGLETPHGFVKYMQEQHGLTVSVLPNFRYWQAEMDDANYIAFLLRWS